MRDENHHIRPHCGSDLRGSRVGPDGVDEVYVDIDGYVGPVSSSPLEATLTFSHDVQVPGVTLKAGSYVFTLISPTTMRITNEERSKVYTTFSTMPASRALTTSHAQVRFERMPDGTTRLVGLYPDDAASGYAPIYRKTHKAPGAPIATSGTKP